MTEWPDPSMVANSLSDLAEANPAAADFAIGVRKVYDMLTGGGVEPADARALLVFQLSLMQQRELITKKHCALADKLLPKSTRKKRGRPKGALGKEAYDNRYRLYLDWVARKALNAALTKEQFAKERLGITEHDLAGDYEIEHRAKIEALLQDLKPARMKQLDEDQRRAIETIYPLVTAIPRTELYGKWCAAREADPALTEEQFVKDYLDITEKHLANHPGASDLIREHMDYLEEGRKLSADRKRPTGVPMPPPAPSQGARPVTARKKRNRAR